MEFAIYKTETIKYPWNPVEDSMEQYWNFIGNLTDVDGNFKFKNLTTLALAYLCISHGNAGPEQGFSVNKNLLDGKESLSEEIIEAIRLVKQSIRLHGGILKFPITQRLIDLVGSASLCYEQNLEKVKSAAAFEQSRKAARVEALTDKQDEVEQC